MASKLRVKDFPDCKPVPRRGWALWLEPLRKSWLLVFGRLLAWLAWLGALVGTQPGLLHGFGLKWDWLLGWLFWPWLWDLAGMFSAWGKLWPLASQLSEAVLGSSCCAALWGHGSLWARSCLHHRQPARLASFQELRLQWGLGQWLQHGHGHAPWHVWSSSPEKIWKGSRPAFWQSFLIWTSKALGSNPEVRVLSLFTQARTRMNDHWIDMPPHTLQALQCLLDADDPQSHTLALDIIGLQGRAALKEAVRQSEEAYSQWLEAACKGGMRGLYRAFKSEDVIPDRPYRHIPLEIRPHIRRAHWAEVWRPLPGHGDNLFIEWHVALWLRKPLRKCPRKPMVLTVQLYRCCRSWPQCNWKGWLRSSTPRNVRVISRPNFLLFLSLSSTSLRMRSDRLD